MKDKLTSTGTFISEAGVQSIESIAYAPPKNLLDIVPPFGVFKSTPQAEQKLTVQYSIRKSGSNEDLLRIDNYGNEYFSSYWDTHATASQFMEGVETFFTAFEDDLRETKPVLGIFSGVDRPEFYEFERPLAESDLNEASEHYAKHADTSFLRIDSPVGDFTYDPAYTMVGFISASKYPDPIRFAEAITNFMDDTSRGISKEAITRILKEVPQTQ